MSQFVKKSVKVIAIISNATAILTGMFFVSTHTDNSVVYTQETICIEKNLSLNNIEEWSALDDNDDCQSFDVTDGITIDEDCGKLLYTQDYIGYVDGKICAIRFNAYDHEDAIRFSYDYTYLA